MTDTAVAAPPESEMAQWGFVSALISFIAAFAIYFVGGAGILAALGRGADKHHHLLVLIAAYQALAFGVVVVATVVVLFHHRASPAALGFRFPGWSTLGVSAAALIPILLLADAIEWLFQTLAPGMHIHGNAAQLLPGHPHLTLVEKALLFLWAAVEAPLVEETLFRGVIFQGLRRSISRAAPHGFAVLGAALVSGALFGLVHWEPHTLPILAFLGIALAYIFQLGRSLFASALVHGLVNALAVVVLIHGT